MLASDDKEFIDYARKLSQQAREPFPHYEHIEIGYNYRMSNILAAIGRGQLRVLDERVKRKREIFDYYKEALGDLQGIEFMPEASYGRCNRWLTVILITPEEFGANREQVRMALDKEDIEARPVWKPMHMQPVFNPQIPQINGRKKAQNTHNWKNYKARVVGGTSRGQKSEIRRKARESYNHNSTLKIQNYPVRVVGGKVSEDLFKRGLCLPSGTAMTEEDLDRVIEVILNLIIQMLFKG
jgi:dTDP-4-amino-4,6-dideoxygalactose transaminase